ncbi:3-phosphoshikimate 1-carboxyvinyltransferase [soil metagenome]
MFAVPTIGRPVAATVRPPGSKSLTNRALVIASLARPAASRLTGALDAEDTTVMRAALRRLGVLIDDNDDPWLVLGTGGDLTPTGELVDVGASGTTARFVTAVAALAKGTIVIDGTPRMRQRPIGPLVAALRMMGASVESRGEYPPVQIRGGALTGGRVIVQSTLSSQFASAVLMVAPLASTRVDIVLEGRVASAPYLEGTVEMMRSFGAVVEPTPSGYTVEPTGYEKAHIDIEADASAAVYPAVAAAITGGQVVIEGIPSHSTQPDLAVLEILRAMGCDIHRGAESITVTGPRELGPVDVDLSGSPDGALAVAVAALFATGPSRIDGLATLRIKETDRLAALKTEMGKVGAEVTVDGDALTVRPRELRPAEIETYDDHRIAMSMALVGLVVPGVTIARPGTVAKTWPGYFDMLSHL